MAQSQAAAVARPVATRHEKRRRTWDDYEGTVLGVVAVTLFLLFWEGVGTKWTYFGWQLPFAVGAAASEPDVHQRAVAHPHGCRQAVLRSGQRLPCWRPGRRQSGGRLEVIAKGSIYKDIWVSFQEFALGYCSPSPSAFRSAC